ncbi:hypothetical protein OHA98_32080 [Streptomyces sp. NBC_00654]|uniref:hypothetical protein n=1 Tax=Streptomyces sp. NBC_00654 TaxID=2975799 RepID=UPI0022590E64|nr:hypothetical protein [Streptomyces sp. NBC_00654]MCX4969313.1 hypothetical protein [Streptomyces sp. NBC_00654]
MTQNTPLSSCPLNHLREVRQRVLSTAQLRARGVSATQAASQCLPSGPWQQLLPGVYLLHREPPTGADRLHGALLYAGRTPAPGRRAASPQAAAAQAGSGYGAAMVTGLAALTLYGFESAPSLMSLRRIDVLVPRTRRLRSTRFVQVLRSAGLPGPGHVAGVPVAPVERALADAVAELTDAAAVRRLLTEAVRGGHSEPAAVVRELSAAKLLSRATVVDAVDSLLAEGRAVAERRLYAMVRDQALPDPLWNVELRMPGGPGLGGVDAYWPDQAVAVVLDTRAPRHGAPDAEDRKEHDAWWSAYPTGREHLEGLGITVVHVTPKKLREAMEQQATVVRTALKAAADREPAAYVMILPR